VRYCDIKEINTANIHTSTHNTHTKKERPSFTGHGNHVRPTNIVEVARGANARPGRAPKNKERSPTRASLATPFQDTADGSLRTPVAVEGPVTEDVKISSFARGEWSYDGKGMLNVDVAFSSSLAAALGDEDNPLESFSVPRLLAVVYAVG
jgi:hypothetical protein